MPRYHRRGRPTGPGAWWPSKACCSKASKWCSSSARWPPDPAVPPCSGRRALATIAVLIAGAWLREPLTRLPVTELKWGVGVLLSAFGVFFAAEGLGVQWPGGDLAILYVAASLGAVSQLQSHRLARQPQPA